VKTLQNTALREVPGYYGDAHLLNQDKIHLYRGRCEKVAGKILKSVSEFNVRQDELAQKVTITGEELNQEVGKNEAGNNGN
jgi:hypothetical protein